MRSFRLRTFCDFLSTIARCKVEPLRPLCGQINLRDLTGVCVTMHWIDRYRTPSPAHCLPKGAGKRFCVPVPSARTAQLFSFPKTVLTPVCLVECIIASATSRALTNENWTSWQHDSLRKLQALTMSRTMTTVSNCRYRYRARTSSTVSKEVTQGKHSPVLRLPQLCEQITSRWLVSRLTRSKVDKTLFDWFLFCQEARKKVKGVSIKLLQVA